MRERERERTTEDERNERTSERANERNDCKKIRGGRGKGRGVEEECCYVLCSSLRGEERGLSGGLGCVCERFLLGWGMVWKKESKGERRGLD